MIWWGSNNSIKPVVYAGSSIVVRRYVEMNLLQNNSNCDI